MSSQPMARKLNLFISIHESRLEEGDQISTCRFVDGKWKHIMREEYRYFASLQKVPLCKRADAGMFTVRTVSENQT